MKRGRLSQKGIK